MIYLITNKASNTCKIGYSRTPQQRIKELQTSNPFKLNLDFIINGDFTREKEIHNLFNNYRLNGEWFNLNDLILNYFKEESLKPLIKEILVDKYSFQKESNLPEYLKSISDIGILLWLNFYKDNKIYLVKNFKEELAKIVKTSLPTIEKGIKELCDKQLLTRIATSTYLINPDLVYSKTDKEREREIAYNILVKYKS